MPSRGQPSILMSINLDFIVQTDKKWDNRSSMVTNLLT
jgi:hypothetical protein